MSPFFSLQEISSQLRLQMESASGFTNSTYGQNTRLLNQAINRLRECGSEAILGEMPKIAVIGNQSAGKSSLIEAMSGVDLSLQTQV